MDYMVTVHPWTKVADVNIHFKKLILSTAVKNVILTYVYLVLSLHYFYKIAQFLFKKKNTKILLITKNFSLHLHLKKLLRLKKMLSNYLFSYKNKKHLANLYNVSKCCQVSALNLQVQLLY